MVVLMGMLLGRTMYYVSILAVGISFGYFLVRGRLLTWSVSMCITGWGTNGDLSVCPCTCHE